MISYYGPDVDNAFGDSPKIRRLAEPVSLILELLNPNQQASTQCRGLLLCQVSSHSGQGFKFYRANIHTFPDLLLQLHPVMTTLP